MTAVQLLWLLLACAWVGLEIAIARRSLKDAGGSQHDQGSALLLWGACLAGLIAALLAKQWHYLPLALPYLPRQAIALALFGVGAGLRLLAVAYLGALFTSQITLSESHHLVFKGPYRWLRHPSYTGLLLAFTGAGVAMGDGLALLSLLVPSTAAVLHRIQLEEAVLARRFPDAYPAYRQRTHKLLPWIY